MQEQGVITERLEYREPFRFDRLLDFFRMRVLEGIEKVDGSSYMRTAAIPIDGDPENVAQGWVKVADDPDTRSLVVAMSEGLQPVRADVASRVRRLFDLDCDPHAVAKGIASLNEAVPGAVVAGTRVPGCFDPFETVCRAVLGQWVSVAAANKQAASISREYGLPVETGADGLLLSWPTPQRILALDDVEEAFGVLGVIGSKSRTIAEISRQLVEGELELNPGVDAERQIQQLLKIKGIGPWTANYIAMRALSYSDAFLETDVGVKHALPDLTPKQRLRLAEAWRPYRSYANLCLWNSLS